MWQRRFVLPEPVCPVQLVQLLFDRLDRAIVLFDLQPSCEGSNNSGFLSLEMGFSQYLCKRNLQALYPQLGGHDYLAVWWGERD